MLLIPWQSGPSFTQTIVLDSIRYNMKADYNGEADRWALSLYDFVSGSVIFESVRLVPQWEILHSFRHNLKTPPGFLLVVSDTEDSVGFEDFINGRAGLYYEPAI